MRHDGRSEKAAQIEFLPSSGLGRVAAPELGDMPVEFRVPVWSAIYAGMRDAIHYGIPPPRFDDPWHGIVPMWWMLYFKRPIDEVPRDPEAVMDRIKGVIMQSPYNKVFDLLTDLVRHQGCPQGMSEFINGELRISQMAYYLDTSGTPTFVPQSSSQEGEAVRDAMSVLAESGIDGAHTHLLNAAGTINQGKFADAVRESIHAVESVAKVISGQAHKDLRPAIKELEKRQLLTHGALAEGFIKLYGYTNDEKGIRHALLGEGKANVGQEEAVFMFGACASFCGYLCRKQAKMSAKN